MNDIKKEKDIHPSENMKQYGKVSAEAYEKLAAEIEEDCRRLNKLGATCRLADENLLKHSQYLDTKIVALMKMQTQLKKNDPI